MTKHAVCRKIISQEGCDGIDCKECPLYVGGRCTNPRNKIGLARTWLNHNKNPRKRVRVEMTEKEYDELVKMSEEIGLSISAFVRFKAIYMQRGSNNNE